MRLRNKLRVSGSKPIANPQGPIDYNHILVIGQSNAVGAAGGVVTTTPPSTPTPLMFSTGLNAGGTGLTSLVPLAESTSETVCSGFAQLMRTLHPDKTFIFSISAEGGNSYNAMRKGTTRYNNALAQITAARSIALAAGGTYRCAALVCLHGEQDELLNNTSYGANLITWQTDYDTDIKAITGQTQDIPLFACQQVGASNSTPSGAGAGASAIQLYNAWKSQPSKVVLVGSRYLYGCQQGTFSNLHISPWAQRWHGQFYANFVSRRVFNSQNYRPLSPIPGQITLSGSTITARFNVEHPPIQIAFDWVGRVGNNCGFTFFDDSGSPPSVTSVTVASNDTLTIQLSGTPTGSIGSRRLRYAYGTSSRGPMAGSTRGNICDSNTLVSPVDGLPLRNWLVIFEEVVT